MGSVKRLTPKIDLVGKICGRLTVIRFDAYKLTGKTKVRNPFWIVRCSCGNERSIRQACLTCIKPTLSCGCLLSEFRLNVLPNRLAERRRIGYGEAYFNRIYADYKIRAKNMEIAFELNRSVFRNIIMMDCHYCGSPPSQNYYFKQTNGQFMRSGIDRKENSLGYTVENSLPCCNICNRAKRTMGYNDFINWIKRLKENVRI